VQRKQLARAVQQNQFAGARIRDFTHRIPACTPNPGRRWEPVEAALSRALKNSYEQQRVTEYDFPFIARKLKRLFIANHTSEFPQFFLQFFAGITHLIRVVNYARC
jgi:hypothetical protein